MSAHLNTPQENMEQQPCPWCNRVDPLHDGPAWQCRLTSILGEKACTRCQWRQCDLNEQNGGKYRWRDNF